MILDWNDENCQGFAALGVKTGDVCRILADALEIDQVHRIDTEAGTLERHLTLPEGGVMTVCVDGDMMPQSDTLAWKRLRIEWSNGSVSFCRAGSPLCTRKAGS